MKFDVAMYADSSYDKHDIVNYLKRSFFVMVDMCTRVNFVLKDAQLEIYVNQADATGRGPYKNCFSQLQLLSPIYLSHHQMSSSSKMLKLEAVSDLSFSQVSSNNQG